MRGAGGMRWDGDRLRLRRLPGFNEALRRARPILTKHKLTPRGQWKNLSCFFRRLLGVSFYPPPGMLGL
jgi:hypothetical protein